MAQKILGAQRDFSYGEVDVALKRSDEHPARKAGLRQMSNMRILNSGAVQNRPGRHALFPQAAISRTEEITMSAGNIFKLVFSAASVVIRDSSGVTVATFLNQGNSSALPWANSNLDEIVYAVLNLSIYITFPGMRPQVVTWDGVAYWTISDYQEQITGGGQKRTAFYRLSPKNVAILPSAATGNITLTANTPLWTAAHVGTRIAYVKRQVLITGYVSPTVVNAKVLEALPGSQAISFSSDPAATFNVGDSVIGSVSGSQGVIIDINLVASNTITVQLLTTSVGTYVSQGQAGVFAFITADTVVGPGGGLKITTPSQIQVPQSTTVWSDEIINDLRGYPASCFVDQYRLGFCNFPQLPSGIAWSAINSPTDLYVFETQPANAIFELAPDKVQVYFVVAGAESSEFIFCDQKLYYIKIDPSSPLVPGSVSFQTLSSDGCAPVQPRSSQELIIYANAGRNSVVAIVAVGNYYRPFNTKNLSDFHGHLFDGISAIAVPNADTTFNERYAYVMNGDGSLVVGKYTVADGQVAGSVGWGPWAGVGSLSWVAAWNSDVLFSSAYFGFGMCEILDDTVYLDCALPVNSPPAQLAAPVGKGPLWFAPSQQVALMDQVTRSMGTYSIDANGFIVPQFNGGENLASASLVAGQSWTSIVEPFCPDANPGQDVGQRMKKRRIARFAAYVVQSTGFVMARLFAGPVTPTSPALGTVMNISRVTAYNIGDDATKPAPLRETAERWRPLGRAYDPRVAIIKDTPGPLQILEIGIEASL